jgi:phage baseplate assembly protein W
MINISNLTSYKSGKKFIFSDLNLDFSEKQVSGNDKNNDIVAGNDLIIDYDVAAIKNSIRNILTQKRYLIDMNVNLRRYIGSPASKINAEMLGEDIRSAIAVYEPRVKVEKIIMSVNEDQNVYLVYMLVRILNFNDIVRMDASFNRHGIFDFINN